MQQENIFFINNLPCLKKKIKTHHLELTSQGKKRAFLFEKRVVKKSIMKKDVQFE